MHAPPGEEYLPALQGLQTEAPAALDEPALHTVHADEPMDEYENGGQFRQISAETPPSSTENLPAAQLVQLLVPADSLYFPGRQN